MGNREGTSVTYFKKLSRRSPREFVKYRRRVRKTCFGHVSETYWGGGGPIEYHYSVTYPLVHVLLRYGKRRTQAEEIVNLYSRIIIKLEPK
jgi:hypothetical protein